VHRTSDVAWHRSLHVFVCINVGRMQDNSDTVGRGTALQVGRLRVLFQMESLGFSNDLILSAALRLCGRLSV
jgi:hypothetical protein